MITDAENKAPSHVVRTKGHEIRCYADLGANIDPATVHSFGEEWQAFGRFTDDDIRQVGATYFDIVRPEMLGPDKTAVDFGCGTGRWTKYIHDKVASVTAVDPSDAILVAAELLGGLKNVHLYRASIDELPFADDAFDFGFSLGVLHHIPDTAKAMRSCVRKIRPGGYFLVYLYYALDNRGPAYKALFHVTNAARAIVSRLPGHAKRRACDLLAVLFYMPFVLLGRTLRMLGAPKELRARLPLSYYEDKSFYIIRNDALDRFGTPLEQRFSRAEIKSMMEAAGLSDIEFSQQAPFWHAVGRRTLSAPAAIHP